VANAVSARQRINCSDETKASGKSKGTTPPNKKQGGKSFVGKYKVELIQKSVKE
jgi:hypothetical protein